MNAALEKNAIHPSPANASHATPASTAKFIFPVGRGCTGRSFWARWLIDRAQSRNQRILVVDADPINPSLEPYFEGVLTPPDDDEHLIPSWLASHCAIHGLVGRSNILVDLGPYAIGLGHIAQQTGIPLLPEAIGMETVVVHLIGPSVGDLAYLRLFDNMFTAKKTILIINEGIPRHGRSVATAYDPVITHPVFQQAVRRGAAVITMPALTGATDVSDRRLTFSAAADGSKNGLAPLGLIYRHIISNWLAQMDERFAPVLPWLT